jgi:hypothetical protein
MVSGFRCHSYANGQYLLDGQMVGAKRAWTARIGNQEAHLFFRDNPDRWCFGDNVQDCFAEFQSYEELPDWQQSPWLEECNGASTDSTLVLDPGYSTHDCEQALQLVQEEVHSRCCTDESECVAGTTPSRCEYDCAHIWFPLSQDCADFLAADAQDFSAFTTECDRTHATMQVLSLQGSVQTGGLAWNATFPALSGVEYKVEMVPQSATLILSELQVIAPHSHHVMASRFDSTTQSGGRKVLQWAATQDEAGVEISVTAIEGAGDFAVEVTIVGTIDHLAPEAITSPPATADVSFHTVCQWYDDCTFRYDGQELRGSGSRFELRLHGVAGLSYAFSTELLSTAGMVSSGTHISVGIYHESALGGSETSERIESADFALGQWTTTSRGSMTYAQLHHCQASPDDPDILTRVPCGGNDGDVGDFRTHPGGSFPTAHSFEWPCAATGTYFIEFIASCDVPFYADTARCHQVSGEWLCPNPADSTCSSETRLRIDVVDESTTVAEQTTMAVDPRVLIPGSEAQAQFASMFSVAQHPAIAYVTEILPVGRGDCQINPCQNGGQCVTMPPSTVDGVPNSNTYRCLCTPSWVGLNCDETMEAQALAGSMLFNRSMLFNVHATPIVPIGGGHRRTQGAEPEPEPEPEPPLAAVMVHARGQTPSLARQHMDRVMGPGGTTVHWDGFTPGGGKGRRRSLADAEQELKIEQLQKWVRELQAQLSSSNYTPLDAAADTVVTTQATAAVERSRRKLQADIGPVATYQDPADGATKLCAVGQCDASPCANGGVCTPSSALAATGGAAAGFTCACPADTSGLRCETCAGKHCGNGATEAPPPSPGAGGSGCSTVGCASVPTGTLTWDSANCASGGAIWAINQGNSDHNPPGDLSTLPSGADCSTNGNGNTFVLFLLPVQPANTFSYDAIGAQNYADICEAAGLRPVTHGASERTDGTGTWDIPDSGGSCVSYNCMPMWVDGNWAATAVRVATGWDAFVTLRGNQGLPGTGAAPSPEVTASPSNYNCGRWCDMFTDGWDVALRPVCGFER